jgi:hypothetical protein
VVSVTSRTTILTLLALIAAAAIGWTAAAAGATGGGHRPLRAMADMASRPVAVAAPNARSTPPPTVPATPPPSSPLAPATGGVLAATATISTSTYQETSSLIAYSGPWGRATNSGYSGGAVRYSNTRGASAALTFSGTYIAWVGPTGPTRGQAKLYLNGRYIRTVNMYSSQFAASRVLYSATFATQTPRRLAIVVSGTSGHPTVAIDRFVVRRTTTTVKATSVVVTFPASTTLKYLATTSLARPGYRVAVLDPRLGTKTTRVSNISGIRQNYSRISAWNADGSKILLGFTYPGRMLDGRTYADLGSFGQISQAIWSNVDPNKLYGTGGNVFYRQNATSGAITALHTFGGYKLISIGDGEGGISDDDHYIALIATTSGGAKRLITYSIASNTIVGNIAVTGMNNAQISRKGNYVVVVNNSDGTARGQGVERYTRNLASRINLTPYGRHGDNALDASGNEIYVSNNAPYVTAFRLSTGAKTRLLSGTTAFEYGHVSGRNIHRPGWIYLSVFNNSITAGRAGHDQVVAVKTDGSGTVEVFGFSHHTNTTTYAMQPHAVPSPDGSRVLFASEWGGSGIYAYVVSR